MEFLHKPTADANGGVASVLASSSMSLYTAGLCAEAPCPSSPAAGSAKTQVVIVGCGFLGRATALLFLSRGWEVIGIARHPVVLEEKEFEKNFSFFPL